MKALLLSALVASALLLSVAENDLCDTYFTNPNMTCIMTYECIGGGSSIVIYEDCSPGSELLTAIDTNPAHDCNHLTVKGKTVQLNTELDAEKDNEYTINCRLFSESYVTEFPVENVNEFKPQVQDQSPIFEINVSEGNGAEVITTFSYQDEDFEETEKLTCELKSGDIDNLFEVESLYQNDMMKFSLKTTDSLDFEKRMYYRLEFDIKSTDSRGDILTSEQTILVFVEDIGDNPPYWIKTKPSVQLGECEADELVLQVEASDRDVEVNNEIRYSITDGNDEGFFSIDPNSGEVKTARVVDRESLATTTFALTITATEIKADGNEADEPNSSTQATNIYIVDVNDNIPTFNEREYYAEIDELSEDNLLNIDIFVTDMDEGLNGTFTLTSDKPVDLVISPSQGMGNEKVSLKAKWRGDDTLFDYETTQDNLTFTLTATESSNPSNIDTATLVVKINDVNDNSPVFLENEYNVDVSETEVMGFLVTTVKATDKDISPEFGTDSIRYSSECEDKLQVDSITGEVTLADDNVLNYESKTTLLCNIEARDLNGDSAGRGGTTKVKITVIDVVDEQPSIKQPDEVTILENTIEGTQVGQPVKATDADEGANIVISIDSTKTKAYLQNNEINPDIVKDWFVISTTTNNVDDYSAVVSVGTSEPDREKADRVELTIVATDVSTQSGINYTSTIFTININNTNDEPPYFTDDYSIQKVTEEVPEGTLIAKLLVNDNDLDDTIDMTISNDSLVRVVMENDFKTWNLEVSPGANIDREKQAEIIVNVTITDSNGASTDMEITISITDINDNTPVIEECTFEVEVAEDKLTGYHVANVKAGDVDIGAHGEIRYFLFNYSPGIPFAVNDVTGEVTVLLEDNLRVLDREMKASWDLAVYAQDGCENGEIDCQAKASDPCNIIVTVTDINDEAPDRFDWNPPAETFTVHEDMLEGELVGGEEPFKIRAQDDDQPGTVNTMITYHVEWVRKVGETENLDLFTAVNKNETWSDGSISYYCQLMATQDLFWQRGSYEILLVAEDSGEPQLSGNKTFDIEILDSNDHVPEFVFYGCLADELQIKMEENKYEAGDKVRCSTEESAQLLEIVVEDEDIGENRDFTCEIDYEKSTAVAVNGIDQLHEFELKRESNGCVLYVKSVIDRESGRRYNLSLHVMDKGTPPLESWEYLEVIVTDAFEAPPYFCLDGLCRQTIYMKETDPTVTANFLKGTDTDNIDFDPNDPGTYQEVYYDIVGGSTSLFELGDRTDNTIKLKNLPQGLDREDVPEYQLYIDVTNDPATQPPISEIIARNYTLYLTIKVQDVNDNSPQFEKAITIASFTQNDEKGKKIAVIQATDLDLNETITYDLGEFTWYDTDGTAPTDEPFKLENGADLILNFKPTGLNSGYCTFPINAYDKDDNTNFTTAKVYVITNAFQLPVVFNNDISMVSEKTEDIEEIFTSVYQYSCVVDSTTTQTSDTGEAVEGKTVVFMHFIDETHNEPVPKDAIIQQTTDVEVIKELRRKLNEINLNLNSVGDEQIVSESNDLLLLQVLLGVVSLVLGSLVILLLIAYCIRTRSLERQVKVLSTNTFGSKESDLNRAGMEMEVVPGSNMFKGEGANPMYNMSEDELRNDDTSSIGSGDSVLVGVEDNPEFKNYINRRVNAPASPFESASGARSIDQVSAPAAFAGTSRSNPLLDMDGVEDRDLSEALRDFEVTIRRSSCESDGSVGHDNPNFTFGK
ncbi:cadherin-23-like [Penaeus chinensis]|uniref:cadherin-23-like n=1 Tax=Penaeus chinensis TaxID=139456 RepID=UPI001FB80C7E|nr:cadherin-23-like [Penaeus chinensis]